MGLLAPVIPGESASADAAPRYYRDNDGGYSRYRYSRDYRDNRDNRGFRRRNNPDSARANNLDPAGDYKAYPDWARAALSPKYDGGNRR